MTAQESQYTDGAWYWVEKEGWIGDPPTIAPAKYKANCDAWYSFEFSGVPTREVKVLEPCARATPPAQPVASIYVTAGGEREFDDWKVPLPVGSNQLYAHPVARTPLSGDRLTDAITSFHGYISGDIADFVEHVESTHGITQETQG